MQQFFYFSHCPAKSIETIVGTSNRVVNTRTWIQNMGTTRKINEKMIKLQEAACLKLEEESGKGYYPEWLN